MANDDLAEAFTSELLGISPNELNDTPEAVVAYLLAIKRIQHELWKARHPDL